MDENALLDDLLLIICIPSFVLYTLVCVIPDAVPGIPMDTKLFVSNFLMVGVSFFVNYWLHEPWLSLTLSYRGDGGD